MGRGVRGGTYEPAGCIGLGGTQSGCGDEGDKDDDIRWHPLHQPGFLLFFVVPGSVCACTCPHT